MGTHLEQGLIENDIDAFLEKQEHKELLRFVTVGSVDDGKSTLIGRLLYDSVGLYEDVLKDAHSGGQDVALDLARITDGLQAEREQGITIDVAYRYFNTPARKFILADTPGHVQYTRNMATGSSTADVAIILIDARHGVLQQSRRHAYIASLLGIDQLAVCVNKMDLKGFEQPVYDQIVQDFTAFAEHLDFGGVTFFPISALAGDNVVKRSERTTWYSGPTLLEFLETVPIARTRTDAPFRLPIQTALRPDPSYRGFAGQVAAGSVKPGDDVVVLPLGVKTKVKCIDTFDGELAEAHPPMSVTLRLADETDCSRGDMIVAADRPPLVGRGVQAMVIWMSEEALDPGRSYLLKHTTLTTRARIDEVCWVMNLDSLAHEESAESLELNDIGMLRISTKRPLIYDIYRENRQTGAFILIDAVSNNTVAAGMILSPSNAESLGSAGRVSSEERRQAFGQRGTIVQVEGDAPRLERALFELGYFVVLTDDENDAVALAEAGVVVLSTRAIQADSVHHAQVRLASNDDHGLGAGIAHLRAAGVLLR